MTFWSGERIENEGAAKAIVDPFSKGAIDCSAYTLTLGAEAFVTPHYGDTPRSEIKLSLEAPQPVSIGGVQRNRGGGAIVIPPGQFAFLLTEETVSIPQDAMGFISLKSKPKFGGLINVSGFHVDPGFTGKLVFSVFNAGPNSLTFRRGDRLFLLWIADLSYTTPDPAARATHRKKAPGYAELPSDLVSQVSRENHSLQSLSKRVEHLTSLVTVVTSVAAALATVLGLYLAWIALKPDEATKSERYEVRIEDGGQSHSGEADEPTQTPTLPPTR